MKLALRRLEATQHQVHELVNVVRDQSRQRERQSGQIERLMFENKQQSQQMERLMSTVHDQSQQIERLMSKDKEQSQQMERLMTTVHDQSQQIERLMFIVQGQSQQIERLMSTVLDQPPQRGRHGPINQIFPTPFEWKIPNFDQFVLRKIFMAGIQRLVSEPFYLLSCGYKYLLKIEIDVLPSCSRRI